MIDRRARWGWLLVPVLALVTASVAPVAATSLDTSFTPQEAGVASGEARARPRIGLVLGGGGARGGAHVGVLRALESMRIPVDVIAGTSIGAIVGGLYAGGMSTDALDSLVQAIDWNDLIRDLPRRGELSFRRKEDDLLDLVHLEFGLSSSGVRLPAGLVAGQKLDLQLRELTTRALVTDRVEDLPIPFRAVAADLETGEMVLFDEGDLASVIRASMAIPGVFTPKRIDGRVLIDGGVARTLPVDVGRSMGADVIVAVDVSRRLDPVDDEPSMLAIAGQAIRLFAKANAARSRAELGEGDVLVAPDLQDIDTMDFGRMHEAALRGEREAIALASRLSALSLAPQEYDAWQRSRRTGTSVAARVDGVDRIEVVGNQRVPAPVIEHRIRTRTSSPLDFVTVHADVQRIFEIGEFDHIDYRLESRRGEKVLRYEVEEKTWGPDYLRVGLRIDGDLAGDTGFLVNLLHRKSFVNRRGAEWRNRLSVGDDLILESDFHQPLDYGGRFFVEPHLYFRRTQGDAFLTPNQQLLIDGYRIQGGVDWGMSWGLSLEMRVGMRWGRLDAHFDQDRPQLQADEGVYQASVVWDGLDVSAFPTHGVYLSTTARVARRGLGATDEYERLHVFVARPWDLGVVDLVTLAEAGTSFGATLPLYDDFQLGGLLRTSGYEWGQLRGDDVLHLGVVALRRLVGMNSLVGRGLFGGVSLEAGHARPAGFRWNPDEMIVSGSLLVGTDTLLGPAYLGWGWAEGGHTAFYAILGHVFPAGTFR